MPSALEDYFGHRPPQGIKARCSLAAGNDSPSRFGYLFPPYFRPRRVHDNDATAMPLPRRRALKPAPNQEPISEVRPAEVRNCGHVFLPPSKPGFDAAQEGALLVLDWPQTESVTQPVLW